MRLTHDILYNAGDPDASPCRWWISVSDCKDSMMYIIPMWISLACAAFSVLAGTTLFVLLGRRQGNVLYPSKWTTSRSSSFSILITVSCQLFSTVVFLTDFITSYGSRIVIFFLPFLTGYVGLVPYLSSLLSGRILGPSGEAVHIPGRRFLRVMVLLIPLGFLISLIFSYLNGHSIEKEDYSAADRYSTIAHILAAVLYAEVVSVSLVVGHSNARRMQMHLASTLNLPPNANIGAYIKNDPPPSEALECAKSAHAVLKRMRYLNYSGALTGLLGVICSAIIAGLPTELLRIPALSKLIFLTLMFAMVTRPTATSFYFLYEEVTATHPLPPSRSSTTSISTKSILDRFHPHSEKPPSYPPSLDAPPVLIVASHNG